MLGSNKLAGNEQFRLLLLDQWLFFTSLGVVLRMRAENIVRMADHPVELRATKRRISLRIQKSLAETVKRTNRSKQGARTEKTNRGMDR